MSNKQWFVVHTKPHKENVALENLERQGFIAYCPKTVQPKRRRQCWQKVTEPLFPRYLFVKLNMGVDDVAPIRSTLGVIDLVRFGNRPAVMPESVIEAIQHQEHDIKNSYYEYPNWQMGDVLEILEGPFVGLKGIFQKKEGTERVSLLLEVLGQQNRFSIHSNILALAI